MAELETAAWLTCRRFRVLCLDRATPSLSFSDLYLRSANSGPTNASLRGLQEDSVEGSTFSIATEEATQQVSLHALRPYLHKDFSAVETNNDDRTSDLLLWRSMFHCAYSRVRA